MDKVILYWKIYLCYIVNDIKSQISYPLDFAIQLFVWFLYTLIPFIGISVLFSKFNKIGDWNLYHVGIMYSVVGFSYDFSRMIGRSFDNFHSLIKSGNLDTLLIRPCPIIIQILGNSFFLRRIAGLFQYLSVLVYSVLHLDLDFKFNLILFCIQILIIVFSTTLVFLGLLILYAAICFITIERNIFTDVFVDMTAKLGYYPIDLMIKPLKIFFTCAIPLAFTAYFPLKKILIEYKLSFAEPLLASLIFISMTIIIFNFAKKNYQSLNA